MSRAVVEGNLSAPCDFFGIPEITKVVPSKFLGPIVWNFSKVEFECLIV